VPIGGMGGRAHATSRRVILSIVTLDVTTSANRPSAAAAAAAALFCPGCGYDLRAIDSDRCPECGLLIDRTPTGQSTLPWAHRHRLGRLRAYARTFALVCFRPQHFRAEMDRPVHFADARAFRRTTVAIAFAPVAIVVVAVYLATFAPPTGWRPLINAISGYVPSALEPLILARPTGAFRSVGYAMELFIFAALLLAIWLWLLAAAGVASYGFHPRRLPVERQNRAVALSYYACAPLAMMPLTVALLATAAMLHLTEVTSAAWRTAADIAALVAGSLQLSGWWFTTLMMLPMTTRCGLLRAAVYFLALPLAWLLLAAWIIGGIVASAVLIAAVIVTMAP
jgi:hypothetical protein